MTTPQTERELLPCPFCGCTTPAKSSNLNALPAVHRIWCPDPICLAMVEGHTEVRARLMWNRRALTRPAAPDAVRGLVEAAGRKAANELRLLGWNYIADSWVGPPARGPIPSLVPRSLGDVIGKVGVSKAEGILSDWIATNAALAAPAVDGGEWGQLQRMFRAIIDAGGPETIARHGVERGSSAWCAEVRAGLLTIERHFHPERFDLDEFGRQSPAATPPADAEAKVIRESECTQEAADHFYQQGYAAALRERPAQVDAVAWFSQSGFGGQVFVSEHKMSVESWIKSRNSEIDKRGSLDGYKQRGPFPLYTAPPPAVDVAALRELRELFDRINSDTDGDDYLNLSCDGIDKIDAILAQQPGVSK